MTTELIFDVILVVVLFAATQLVKKFANDFFTKISKFVPVIIGAIAIVATGIFGAIHNTWTLFSIDNIKNAVQFGLLIAASEVYTYEGVYKLIKKGIELLHKTEKVVADVQKATEGESTKDSAE